MTISDIPRYLLPGILITIELTAIVSAATIVLAIALAILGEGRGRVGSAISTTYIELFRAIPQLALILLVYFGAPILNGAFAFSGFWSAAIALSIGEAGYTAAIYRAAIRSIATGQWEAGYSVGLTRGQIYRSTILPQAALPAIGPTVNMVIYTIKGTSLASIITVNEMTLRAESTVAQYSQPLATFMVLLALYVALTLPLGYLGRFLERRFSAALGGLGQMG